ncbi:MAG: hypothetical protein IPK60_09965 [Sandaracinaceae bacterium]|nr:hypothetical protein [Sandaracinaceae bacterium]
MPRFFHIASLSVVLALASLGCVAEVTPTEEQIDEFDEDGKADRPSRVTSRVPETIEHDGDSYRRVSWTTRQTFSRVSVTKSHGESRVLTFDIPETAVGFTVVIHGTSTATYSYVYRLTDPNGREIISPEPEGVSQTTLTAAGRGQAVSPNGVQAEVFPSISFTPVPTNMDVDVVPGRWSMEIAREVGANGPTGATTRTVEILVKHMEEAFTNETLGMVSVNLYVAPGTPFGSASNSASEAFADAIALYERAGIILQFESVQELEAQFNEQETSSREHGGAPNPEFIDLMTDFDRDPGTINTFIVEERNENPSLGIATFAGGDASLSSRSSVFAGVIISTNRADRMQGTFAHELGHHLGLYHTNIDQLGDTFDYDHYLERDQVTAQRLSFAEASNLMNVGGGALKISEEQIAVMLRRPSVTLYARD